MPPSTSTPRPLDHSAPHPVPNPSSSSPDLLDDLFQRLYRYYLTPQELETFRRRMQAARVAEIQRRRTRPAYTLNIDDDLIQRLSVLHSSLRTSEPPMLIAKKYNEKLNYYSNHYRDVPYWEAASDAFRRMHMQNEGITTTPTPSYNIQNTFPFFCTSKETLRVPPNGTPNSLLYGVELETEIKVPKDISSFGIYKLRAKRAYSVVTSLPGFFSTKTDGSLDGARGFEIVSVPATLKAHYIGWSYFFGLSFSKEKNKYIKAPSPSDQLNSYVSGRCGMHVHINRKALTPSEIGRLWNFYHSIHSNALLSRIAGRQITRTEMVQMKMNGRTTSRHNYCKATNVPFKVDFLRNNGPASDKYTALNLSPPNTVEVRIFRGNTSSVGFFKNLEFVDASVHFVKNESDVSPTKFLKWLEANNANYPFLRMWMKRHKVFFERTYGL